jgi:plastocyanin
MKKAVPIIGVVIIILAVGGIVLAKHNSDNKSSDKSMNMSSSSKSTDTGSSSSSQASSSTSNSVTIENFAFSPASITVKAGTTVTWTNKDSATHTVTETDSQTGPNSGDLATGKSYSFKFDTAGTYKYHCSIHPDMTGTVTVTQ